MHLESPICLQLLQEILLVYIYIHFVHLKTEGKPVTGNNICIQLHTISFFIETLVKIHFRQIDQT